jgi:predicted RNase H-like HicB family nuclease
MNKAGILMDYVVIYEEGDNSCSAYVPDLPGCIAAGDTVDEVNSLISEAIVYHIEIMKEEGEVVPLPTLNLSAKS